MVKVDGVVGEVMAACGWALSDEGMIKDGLGWSWKTAWATDNGAEGAWACSQAPRPFE